MADFGISAGQFVAVVWDKSSLVEALKQLVDELQALTDSEGQVSVENVNQLLQCRYPPRSPSQGGGSGWGRWVSLDGCAAFPLFLHN